MPAVRDYTDSDRAALGALVLALHETVRPMDPDLAPGEEILEAYLAHLIARQAETRGAIFVAEADGALVGYAVVYGSVLPAEPDERPLPGAYLADLYVAPSQRGSGLGEALVARVESHARAVGAAKLELSVLAPNADARRFYARLGFAERTVVLTKRFER
jgi:GNAT superfamily N-acetyltransferase